MVGPRSSPAKELPAGHPLLAAMLVARSRERRNVVLQGRFAGTTAHHVENGLRAHARDRGTADVFQPKRQRAAMGVNPLVFGGEQRRPRGIILHHAHDPRLEAERVSHRSILRDAP